MRTHGGGKEKFQAPYQAQLDADLERVREMSGLIMQDFLNKKEGKVAPDTAGADFFFLEGFVTDQMEWDFPYIEKDFIKHCYEKLPEYDKVAWYPKNTARYSTPGLALQGRIMGLIHNGARSGDEYCLALIKYLHKLYHKKEYNQLKRFRQISLEELLALSEEDGRRSYTAIGRLVTMCAFYGIEMEERCSVLYLWLNKIKDKWDAYDDEAMTYEEFEPGIFEECGRQIDEWYEQETKEKRESGQFKKYWKVEKFVSFCLRHWGYPDEYIEQCMENNMGLRMQFVRAYAVLKSVYPSGEFTFEEVQIYTHLYSAIAALVDVSDQCDMDTDCLLGVEGDDFEEEDAPLFRSESLLSQFPVSQEKPERKAETNLAPVKMGEAGEEDYLAEIAELRKRLNAKEQENQRLQELYHSARREKNEAAELLKKYEGDREELIALREFAYRSAVGDSTEPLVSLEEMRESIAELKLVIIGGHVNWTNKLKNQFPLWTFVSPQSYRSVDSKMLDGKDHIYFFTDYISHAAYGKFIAIVRERKIPFGYLSSVNLDSTIRLIYKELKQ